MRAIPVTDAQREVLSWLAAGPRRRSELGPGGHRLAAALTRKGLAAVDDQEDPTVVITDLGRAAVARYQALATVNDPAVADLVERLIDAGPPARRSQRGVIGKERAGVSARTRKNQASPLPAGAGKMHGHVETTEAEPAVVRIHGRWMVRRRF